MSQRQSERLRPKVSFAAVMVAGLLSVPASSLTQAALPDPAAEFVKLTADIEILSWEGGIGDIEGPRSQSFQVDAVVGKNKWLISNLAFDQTNQYSFDGTTIVERRWINRVASASGPEGTDPSDHWWTRSYVSPDGNPSETVRVLDHLDLVSRIAWLAFCSSPTLNNPRHKLYPPWDIWKQYLDPASFVEKVTRFEDDLGLPKNVLLFSGEHQPVVDYRVSVTTNVAGWLLPQNFFLVEYNPTGTKGWMLALLAHGRVFSITTAGDPFPTVTGRQQPQEQAIWFTPVSPSKMHIEGTSDVHDWSLDTTNVVGLLELNQPLFGPTSQQASRPQPETLQAHAEFFFPVRHFGSGESAPMFSDKADQAVLHHALKTTANPNIVYRLHRLTATNAPPSEPSTLVFQSTGEVVMGGVTNPISIPINVARQDDALTLSGSTTVRLSDFGIEPPSAEGKGWAVKVGNTVESSFELHLKQVERH